MNEVKLLLIEEVSSGPKDGKVQAFTFGEVYGIVQGMFGMLQIPILKTRPGVWKSQLGLSSDKNKSILLAQKTFPEYTFKKSEDGKAEAALLARMAYAMATGKQ